MAVLCILLFKPTSKMKKMIHSKKDPPVRSHPTDWAADQQRRLLPAGEKAKPSRYRVGAVGRQIQHLGIAHA